MNIRPRPGETLWWCLATPPSPNSGSFREGGLAVGMLVLAPDVARPWRSQGTSELCACYSRPSCCRSRPWKPLRGRPGRSGPAAPPSRSASPQCPRRPPCACGTAPATSTAARHGPPLDAEPQRWPHGPRPGGAARRPPPCPSRLLSDPRNAQPERAARGVPSPEANQGFRFRISE
jgi:hypothetical protein